MFSLVLLYLSFKNYPFCKMLCLIDLGVAEQIAGFHFMHMYIYMKSVKEYITPFFQFVY